MRYLLAFALMFGLAVGRGQAASLMDGYPYIVEVSDVTAHVGQHAVMHITLRMRPGYRVMVDYRNRVSQFSSFDNKVEFDRPVVQAASADDDKLVFDVGVTPTESGRHAINGLFRVAYISDSEHFSMISVPLIANVIGQN